MSDIRNTLDFTNVYWHKISTAEFDATTIGINFLGYDLPVTALYCPPKHNIKTEKYLVLFRYRLRHI